MIKFLKKESLIVLSCLLLSVLGTLALSYRVENLTNEQLWISGLVLAALFYLLIKFGSFLFKILLIALLLGVLFYFFKS